MRPSSSQQIFAAVVLSAISLAFHCRIIDAFCINGKLPYSYQRRHHHLAVLQKIMQPKPLCATGNENSSGASEGSDDNEIKSMSFDEAAVKLLDEEERARAERTGNTVSEKEVQDFASKQDQYNSMRDRIRARASELNMEKSKATSKAIEEATARAMNMEEPQALDMSKFTLDDDEDELTPDEKREIDRISQMNWIDQAREEFANTKWPSAGATLRQAGLMLVIFAITSLYILKLDDTVRTLYTDFGLIPPSDAEFDFSDLELPDKWTEMMDAQQLEDL